MDQPNKPGEEALTRALRRTKVGQKAHTDGLRQPIAVAIDHISPDAIEALSGKYFRVCRLCAYNPLGSHSTPQNPTGCPHYTACMSRYRPDRQSVVFIGLTKLRRLTLLDIEPYRKHLFHLDTP